MTEVFVMAAHHALTVDQLQALEELFDREYADAYGPWDPDRPYGYSPAQTHVMAVVAGRLVGHVGFQPRSIAVGDDEVVVAGTGGVLVAPPARGTGLGGRLMHEAQAAMRRSRGVEFGYLGCRPEVVAFYESTGWRRLEVAERHLSWTVPGETVESSGSPVLICPAAREVDEWPTGGVDLRGTPW